MMANNTHDVRWSYCFFSIAMGLYHLLGSVVWGLWAAESGMYAEQECRSWTILYSVCGVLPSLMTFVLIIMESIVWCCNPYHDSIVKTNICCGLCFGNGKWIMALPMTIAAFLRSMLFVILMAFTLSDAICDPVFEESIDDAFFLLLMFCAVDTGPMILLAIDWWYFYSESANGLFGRSTNPLRIVIGQSTLLFVASWSFIVLWERKESDDVWPFFVHAVVSTAVLMFCAMIRFKGIVNGRMLSSTKYGYAAKALGAVMGITMVAILMFIFAAVSEMNIYSDPDDRLPLWLVLLYCWYYSALSLPSVVAMMSFSVEGEDGKKQDGEGLMMISDATSTWAAVGA